jgi:hypothetical protein
MTNSTEYKRGEVYFLSHGVSVCLSQPKQSRFARLSGLSGWCPHPLLYDSGRVRGER